LILKWSKYPCVFSLAFWQHINFIGEYEFYNREHNFNIQEVINKFTDVFKIDISSVSLMEQGFTGGRSTNGSFGQIPPNWLI